MIELKGIAWNHTRGFTSVVAAAQRFEELQPNIRITWEKRSLQAFADASLAQLTGQYDLLVMDNPHVSIAVKDNYLLPFDDYLSADFLKDQMINSVGHSYASYHLNGKQWTLATDAATPIATWRADLMKKHNLSVPQTWDQVCALAKKRHIAFASIPIDTLMHHYMLCHALSGSVFKNEHEVAPLEVMIQAIEKYKALLDLVPGYCLESNPIQIAERMTRTDEISYSPFNYGYCNYSTANYADHILTAGGLVSLEGKTLCSTLGGAGLAVSAQSEHVQAAMQYCQFCASEKIQKGLYFDFGGQPGHRQAWLDDKVNAASNQFFKNTLNTVDQAILRPQYYGYMHFQDEASVVIFDAITGKNSVKAVAQKMNEIYKQSRTL
jgi:multiple sugar transport system substrate-binding protein